MELDLRGRSGMPRPEDLMTSAQPTADSQPRKHVGHGSADATHVPIIIPKRRRTADPAEDEAGHRAGGRRRIPLHRGPRWSCRAGRRSEGSDRTATIYRIQALLRRFDEFDVSQGQLTGLLGLAFGEILLLDLLAHSLGPVGAELLAERPRRDDASFDPLLAPCPSVRDLDAWLVVPTRSLIAAECKHWTASSIDARKSVPTDPDALGIYARTQWEALTAPDCWQQWTGTTKVALPLRAPTGFTAEDVDAARRILIVWRPVSADGVSPLSRHTTTTLRNGVWVDVIVEVFSASLYLRQLQARGVTEIPAAFRQMAALLEAMDALVGPRRPRSRASLRYPTEPPLPNRAIVEARSAPASASGRPDTQ
ncbi:hypothetical protein [Streptacidiphilus sp. EB103A]|uniref:hypothetical protein n=1 Tax=Streptacidiphilus sp. EB103A TaxID=3156275 RepID=UPI003514DF23